MRSLAPIAIACLAGLAVAAAGCGAGDPTTAAPAPAAEGDAIELTVHVDNGGGDATDRAVRCPSATESRDGESRACPAVRNNVTLLTTQPEKDRVCTQQYGGPETALVMGHIGDQGVNRSFARRDGCEIDDWNKVTALFSPGAADPTAATGTTTSAGVPPPPTFNAEGAIDVRIGRLGVVARLRCGVAGVPDAAQCETVRDWIRYLDASDPSGPRCFAPDGPGRGRVLGAIDGTEVDQPLIEGPCNGSGYAVLEPAFPPAASLRVRLWDATGPVRVDQRVRCIDLGHAVDGDPRACAVIRRVHAQLRRWTTRRCAGPRGRVLRVDGRLGAASSRPVALRLDERCRAAAFRAVLPVVWP